MTDLAQRQDATAISPESYKPGMASSAVEPRVIEKRRWMTLAVFALAVVVVGAGTWFSNAQSVQDIAADGAVGVRAEAALSAAAVARNRLAQAILLHTAVELDVAPVAELDASIESTRSALTELGFRAERLRVDTDAAGDPADELTSGLVDVLSRAVNALARDDVGTATSTMNDVDDQFSAVAIELAAIRDDSMSQMIVARETAGQVAVGARMVVAFLIPLATVLLHRFSTARVARRRELEHELERERTTLRAKDELIANISHELRTPLTGILGFAQTAALDDDLSATDHQEMAEMIAGEADELSRMVDDLITTARDDESEVPLVIEAMDPNDELATVLIPATIAGRAIDVEVEPARILADRLRFRQILRNLVSNAVKYGGPRVRVIGQVEGDRYMLHVIDDGDGVSSAVEERLFTRFLHRGDTPLVTGSVGLGTSIASRLAVLMNGSVEYSRRDDDTYFTLTLPIAEEPTISD